MNVQYQFWCYNPLLTPAWCQLQAYSTQTLCQWNPTTAGNYLLAVTAQDGSTGMEVTATAWYAITSGTPLTAVSFTASPTTPQALNTPITLTAVATGGTNVQYQFWVYSPAASSTWCLLQAYSSQSTCRWTPSAAGSYFLAVTAKDGITGQEVTATAWYAITERSALTAVAVSPSLPSPQMVNTAITLTTVATGGTSVQYMFWVYNPAAAPAWSQLQGYSSLAKCTWQPSTPGNYLLSVTAYDGSTGTEVNTMFWYVVE